MIFILVLFANTVSSIIVIILIFLKAFFDENDDNHYFQATLYNSISIVLNSKNKNCFENRKRCNNLCTHFDDYHGINRIVQ